MGVSTFILLSTTFFIHSSLCMLLARRIVIKERFSQIIKVLICFGNAILCPAVISLFGMDNTNAYIILSIVITLEILFLFKDKILALFAISSGILIHFFTLRSIVLGIHSLISNTTMADILNNYDVLLANTFVVFCVHIVVLILFITLIPPPAVKEIIANKTFLSFISFLMIAICLFLIYNAKIFRIDSSLIELSIQQIILPPLLMGIFYIMLLFMIRLVMLDKYKKLIQELENKIDSSKIFADALFNLASIVIEINCTKSKVTKIIINSMEIPASKNEAIGKYMDGGIEKIIHPDSYDIINVIAPESIINNFNKGIFEQSFEYRAYEISANNNSHNIEINSTEYIWYKINIISKQDPNTGDIISIYAIDDINDDKKAELALLEKSEKDQLTSAYNKEAIKNLIGDYLTQNKHGVFFIFDIDNFKSINDTMGHSYGDNVLCEIYESIRPLFRTSDYIGRFGGDEFVAFFKGKTTIKDIEALAMRICNTVRKVYKLNDDDVPISSSIGIAIAPLHGTNYTSLFEAADIALYQSKNKGKDTFTIYNKNT